MRKPFLISNIIHLSFLFFYRFSLFVYYLGIRLAANFNPKAKLWVDGRKAIFLKLQTAFKEEKQPVIWMHCASLGEFEQGRPLIEILKKDYTQYKILLTFFSPSGFEVKKDYPLADYIFYLPIDNPKNAIAFLDIIQPKFALFVKYEFWYYYLKALKDRQIKYFLIAGVFRENQLFFKWFSPTYLSVIKGFNQLFLQDTASLKLIKSKGFEHGVAVGDPRIDRVIKIAKENYDLSIIHTFKNNKKLFILGSSHAKDEQIFFEFINSIIDKKYFPNWQFLIAPHEIKAAIIARIEASSPVPISRYTQNEKELNQHKILILDTIGQLSRAYQYGTCSYIGGGFDESIHNILEPAAFGLPIIFGPNYTKFQEAHDLLELGGAISITNSQTLLNVFEKLIREQTISKKGNICRNYIAKNQGASKVIIDYLNKKNVL